MSTDNLLPRPTDSELGILRVLWRLGPSTVRDVHDVLSRKRPTGYTTVLKLLQIMTEKGLVTRNEQDRAHIYAASQTEDVAQQRLVSDLVDRAFDGSARKLILQALATRRTSPEEIDEIRRLLDSLTGEKQKGGE
jgi:predicted transcriptional regulator